MRIAIDFTATPQSKTGIGRYLLGLLAGLLETDTENEYYLFIHDDDLDGFPADHPRFHKIAVHSRILRNTWIRILWEQFVFPYRLRKIGAQILHSPNFTMPYFARIIAPELKIVGTFHDMTYFFLPDFHVGWKREMFKAYIRHTARKADKLITISENSKKDIPLYCKPKNPSIAVTCMGVEPRFFDAPLPEPDFLINMGIDGPYILYIGTLEPRKNVPGLINAYRQMPEVFREKYRLVLCGKKGWLYDEIFRTVESDPNLAGRVIFTGYVDDDALPTLLAGASAFAYVSFYEGFGIPVIEAMAAGVPTVTSYGSSLEEVAGDGAILCDPKDAADIARALVAALTDRDTTSGQKRIENGRIRAGTYTWDRCAQETIAAYRDAMGEEKRR